jgi:hypothetical protein
MHWQGKGVTAFFAAWVLLFLSHLHTLERCWAAEALRAAHTVLFADAQACVATLCWLALKSLNSSCCCSCVDTL